MYHIASIYVYFTQHILRLICDLTVCVIFYNLVTSVSAQFERKESYQIKYAIWFIFQMTVFDLVFKIYWPKYIFQICISAVLLVDNN